jgi:O-antigen/teichoic acid export membrane protein
VVAYAPVTILVVYLSVRRARPRLSLAVSLVGLVATTVASLLLIPDHGSTGAGAASSIGYGAGALAAWLFFAWLARTPRPDKSPGPGMEAAARTGDHPRQEPNGGAVTPA